MSTILEILSDANKNIKTIVAHKNNAYLRKFMEAAFVPEEVGHEARRRLLDRKDHSW